MNIPLAPKAAHRPTIALAALCAFLTAFGTAHAALNVVVTTADLAAVAKEIGGDRISITTLAKPTEDPHFLDAKPSFIAKLNRADALIEGGAELEAAWLQPLLAGARNQRLAPGAPGHISCAAPLSLLEIPTTLDRSRGDVHGAGNPHYMTDPENARLVARHICASLSSLDAGSAAQFQANLKQFETKLSAKLASWQQALAPFKNRRIVAYHNTWPYFANRFGLRVDLFLEPKPGIPPTPTHLSEVTAQMKNEGVRVIILEPFQDRKTAEAVAKQTGATVLQATQYPGGLKGTEGGYFELLDQIVNPLAAALTSPPATAQP